VFNATTVVRLYPSCLKKNEVSVARHINACDKQCERASMAWVRSILKRSRRVTLFFLVVVVVVVFLIHNYAFSSSPGWVSAVTKNTADSFAISLFGTSLYRFAWDKVGRWTAGMPKCNLQARILASNHAFFSGLAEKMYTWRVNVLKKMCLKRHYETSLSFAILSRFALSINTQYKIHLKASPKCHLRSMNPVNYVYFSH